MSTKTNSKIVMSEISNGGDDYDDNESSSDDFPSGAKVQVTGHRSGHRLQATGQVTGHRTQATGHRPQVRSQVTQKTIGHWTKLFWTDVLLYKNKISQGTLMIFLSFKQY